MIRLRNKKQEDGTRNDEREFSSADVLELFSILTMEEQGNLDGPGTQFGREASDEELQQTPYAWWKRQQGPNVSGCTLNWNSVHMSLLDKAGVIWLVYRLF